ncbi:MAG: hypothetical protein ACTHON_07170, partial [Humibacter sp.]
GVTRGTYTLTYQECETNDPTNCATATISVLVTAAATPTPSPSTSAPAAAGGTTDPGSTPSTAPVVDSNSLASTGSDLVGPSVIGLILAMLGGTFLVLRGLRRRAARR